MKFPYAKFNKCFLPIVPIELKGKQWVIFDAYVDSGASYSMFHNKIEENLLKNSLLRPSAFQEIWALALILLA